MRTMYKFASTMNIFLCALLFMTSAQAQEKKDLALGEFTPEKAIELLLSEPLDEAINYTKDENGPVCEYRNKHVRFQVRFCDSPKKGRIAGTIIHIETRQAVAYLIQLRSESDFDYGESNTYIHEDFSLRSFRFIFPFVEYVSDEKPNPPVCEAGYFYPPATPTQAPTRRNFSRCDHEMAASFQANWRASGEKLREDMKNKLIIDLTNLHITKYSTPPVKK